MKNDYDVIVIGSGVSGALIAWKLAKAGRRVLILDAGSKLMEEADRAKFVTGFTQALQKDRTPSRPYQPSPAGRRPESSYQSGCGGLQADWLAGDKPYFIQVGPDVWQTQFTRLIGGTTWSWRGNCPRFIPNDFKLQSLYQQGADWPIDYKQTGRIVL